MLPNCTKRSQTHSCLPKGSKVTLPTSKVAQKESLAEFFSISINSINSINLPFLLLHYRVHLQCFRHVEILNSQGYKNTLTTRTRTAAINTERMRHETTVRRERCCCLLSSQFQFAWLNQQKWEHHFEDSWAKENPLLLAVIWRQFPSCSQNISHSPLSLPAFKRRCTFSPLPNLQSTMGRGTTFNWDGTCW